MSEHTNTETRVEPRWLNAKDAAAYLGLTAKSIYNAVATSGLPAHRAPNGRLLFRADELDTWVVSGEAS
jgi:excisionase family DNA binding protein